MSAASELTELDRELDACLGEVMRLARSAAHATRAEWRALVEGLTDSTTALPPGEGGANPAEVRAVLLAVQTLYEARLLMVEQHMSTGERDELDDRIWWFRNRRLRELVANELAAYIKIAAPRPSIANVFAKAARNVGVAAQVELRDAHVQLHRCERCGAPRRTDGLYGNCLYCGRALFGAREELE